MNAEILFWGLCCGIWVATEAAQRRAVVVEPIKRALSPPEPTTVEQLHEEYVAGEIGEAELERRLADALDERTDAIREEVEAVDDVGPIRAAEIAETFESVEAVRRASVDELQEAEHVGEAIAVDVHQHFR